MARFQFRLGASLRLAEQALETVQRELAQAVQQWQVCVKACELQQARYNEAQAGQREASRHRPEELGIWQMFSSNHLRRLRLHETERRAQELVVENVRRLLLEAHREVEKFQRLEEKQAKAFLVAELQKEQKILDETGQVLYWRQQSEAIQNYKEG